VDEAFSRTAQQRVEYWTLALGAAGALVSGFAWGWAESGALGLGAALSWLNYRWLKQGVAAFAAAAATQSGAEKVRIPRRVYVRFFGRYALLLAALYAILTGSRLPGLAFLCGLFALVAAVLLEMLYELVRAAGQA
jgi:ATP synthase I subunit